MKVLYEIEKCPVHTSVALGYFDGVHKGHMSVIDKTKKSGLSSVVFTFDDNPQNFFSKNKIKKIYSRQKKIDIFQKIGVERLYLIPFEKIFSLTSRDFFEKILVEKLNAKHVSCGFNYHFGIGAKSTSADLKKMCETHDIKVNIANPILSSSTIVSSTKIRELISCGNISSANKMLGRVMTYKLPVYHEKKISRKLVFPTIIQTIPDNLIFPKVGIYASTAEFDNIKTLGVTKVSTKNNQALMETLIPYCTGESLSGRDVEISLLDFIGDDASIKDSNHIRERIFFDKFIAQKIISDSLSPHNTTF